MAWSVRAADSALARYVMEQGGWHYKDALLFKAVLDAGNRTGEPRYWRLVQSYIDRHVDPTGCIGGYATEEYNLDLINPGKLLFPLYRETGDERYRSAILKLREQLSHQPRTRAGGFWHKAVYPYQMWLDGVYMSAPFLAEFAAAFDEPDAFDDVALQIRTIEEHTRDPETGLLYHAWDETRKQPWADPSSGCSPCFWSRAIGWYAMAIIDVLDIFPRNHSARPELISILNRTLTAIAGMQDAASGLWWQVLDQGSRQGNYLEASGTCMFVYAFAKGTCKGYLDPILDSPALTAFQGVLDHLVTVDSAGSVDLHGVCTSAGLGGEPYRDGSFEYYVSEPVATNDLHGVGPFILAALAVEELAARETHG